VESKTPASSITPFQAASLTKLLTAVLVMQQVEAGRLSLDAKVNDLLPPARRVRTTNGAEAAVTLRELLSHSSGIPFRSAMETDPTAPLSTSIWRMDWSRSSRQESD
jgi:CubicO group peptidase (beta-lactamase class C family)